MRPADPAPPAQARAPRLQRDLLVWLLGPLLVLMALDTGVSWLTAVRAAGLAHDHALRVFAQQIAQQVRPGAAGKLELGPEAASALVTGMPDRRAWRIADAAGASLGGGGTFEAAERVAPGDAVVFVQTRIDGQPARLASVWLPVSAAGGERLLVQVAETEAGRQALASEILAQEVLPQLLLIALATATVYLGVRRGLRPLSRLRRSLASRSHRDLRPLTSEYFPAEVRPLADEVNQLMERLGKAMDHQSRFVSDAAHQLKTPVSGLKAQIELALRETDPHALHRALRQLQAGADRMSRLVAQLLALARNEPDATSTLRLEPADLAGFALERSMEWVPQALRRGIDLGFDGPAQACPPVLADTERLRDLLDNLIDNAVRYGREDGRITVSVSEQPRGQVRLSVHDDGPRIPAHERERIFERFHRLLGAQAEGSGLGLAIVREIASLHGAQVTLEDDADGIGNTFTIMFPALDEAAAEPASAAGARFSISKNPESKKKSG